MEIRSLTGIRGVFALYVVSFHLIPRVFNDSVNNLISNGYIAVDLFFILSGFIMSTVYNEKFKANDFSAYSGYLFNRFARIYPLYIALYAATLFIVFMHDGTKESPYLTAINVFLMQSIFGWGYIQSAWSISTEAIAYLLFPFALVILKRRAIVPVAFFASIAALIYLSLNNSRISIDVSGGAPSIMRCLADYVIGLSMYLMYSRGMVINRVASYIMSALIVAMLCLTEFDVYVIILLAFVIPSLVDENNLISKILSLPPIHYIGVISYSLYLIHSILIHQLRFIFDGMPYSTYLILLTSIIASMITYHLIENPCRKYLKRFSHHYTNEKVSV